MLPARTLRVGFVHEGRPKGELFKEELFKGEFFKEALFKGEHL